MPALLLVFFVRPFLSGRTEERIALPPDLGEEVERFPGNSQFENKRPGMPDDPSRQGKESPSDGAERPCPAEGRKKIPLEADEQVIGQDPDPEEDGVCVKIPGGHVPDPHVILQSLEKIGSSTKSVGSL